MTLLVAAIILTVFAVCLGEAVGPDMVGWVDGAWRAWLKQYREHTS